MNSTMEKTMDTPMEMKMNAEMQMNEEMQTKMPMEMIGKEAVINYLEMALQETEFEKLKQESRLGRNMLRADCIGGSIDWDDRSDAKMRVHAREIQIDFINKAIADISDMPTETNMPVSMMA